MNGTTAFGDASAYDKHCGYVWAHAAGLVELLAAQPGERIVDLGCGQGRLTAEIAAAGAVVTGLDRSESMIAEAAKSYPGIEWRVGSATDFSVPEPVDAVFSNAVLHWVPEADAAAACIFAALKRGGRLVAEFGSATNVRGIVRGIEEALTAARMSERRARNPWYFPTTGEYAGVLERAGFRVTAAWHFDRPTHLGDGDDGLRHWLEVFAAPFFDGLPPGTVDHLIQDVENRLRPTHFREGAWHADYVRLRVMALRPGI